LDETLLRRCPRTTPRPGSLRPERVPGTLIIYPGARPADDEPVNGGGGGGGGGGVVSTVSTRRTVRLGKASES